MPDTKSRREASLDRNDDEGGGGGGGGGGAIVYYLFGGAWGGGVETLYYLGSFSELCNSEPYYLPLLMLCTVGFAKKKDIVQF